MARFLQLFIIVCAIGGLYCATVTELLKQQLKTIFGVCQLYEKSLQTNRNEVLTGLSKHDSPGNESFLAQEYLSFLSNNCELVTEGPPMPVPTDSELDAISEKIIIILTYAFEPQLEKIAELAFKRCGINLDGVGTQTPLEDFHLNIAYIIIWFAKSCAGGQVSCELCETKNDLVRAIDSKNFPESYRIQKDIIERCTEAILLKDPIEV